MHVKAESREREREEIPLKALRSLCYLINNLSIYMGVHGRSDKNLVVRSQS